MNNLPSTRNPSRTQSLQHLQVHNKTICNFDGCINSGQRRRMNNLFSKWFQESWNGITLNRMGQTDHGWLRFFPKQNKTKE
jgi:hypothetical protein